MKIIKNRAFPKSNMALSYECSFQLHHHIFVNTLKGQKLTKCVETTFYPSHVAINRKQCVQTKIIIYPYCVMCILFFFLTLMLTITRTYIYVTIWSSLTMAYTLEVNNNRFVSYMSGEFYLHDVQCLFSFNILCIYRLQERILCFSVVPFSYIFIIDWKYLFTIFLLIQ
jgi:hypothetical protein